MKKIIIFAAFGYLAVLLTGMLFYRLKIFNPNFHHFQIVELGFIGAVMYPLFYYRERKETFLIFIIMLVTHFLLFKPTRFAFIIRDAIILFSVFVTILVYTVYLEPKIRKRYKVLRIFTLPFLYGVIYAASFILLMVILYLFFGREWSGFGATIMLYLQYGFIIGFGLAIGFNFAELIINKYIEAEEVPGH
jgi:hypothetical protein